MWKDVVLELVSCSSNEANQNLSCELVSKGSGFSRLTALWDFPQSSLYSFQGMKAERTMSTHCPKDILCIRWSTDHLYALWLERTRYSLFLSQGWISGHGGLILCVHCSVLVCYGLSSHVQGCVNHKSACDIDLVLEMEDEGISCTLSCLTGHAIWT